MIKNKGFAGLLSIFLFHYFLSSSFAQFINPDICQRNIPCFGRNGYIEYIRGNLPVILSAPHGGYLIPSEIPNRNCSTCTTGRDSNSQEFTRVLRDELFKLTGKYPHIIINNLARVKLDANREIGEATLGDQNAQRAWYEYHEFIDFAKQEVSLLCGTGQYFDLHTQASGGPFVELGTLLTSSDLLKSNSALDTGLFEDKSSIRSLSKVLPVPFSSLTRGTESFGSLLAQRGYRSIPSIFDQTMSGGGTFFSGGYNTARHGSRNGGLINGIQVESHYSFMNITNRKDYAVAFADTVIEYMKHYTFDLKNDDCRKISLPVVSITPPNSFFTISPVITSATIPTVTVTITPSPSPIVSDLKFMGVKLGELKEGQQKVGLLHAIVNMFNWRAWFGKR